MKREEKQLLLKDLCARLPYNVCVKTKQDEQVSFTWNELKNFTHNDEICKPYLRQMSSMTEDEIKVSDGLVWSGVGELEDWLNEHHFDYRGLIEKGLAIEAPEGMYKTD